MKKRTLKTMVCAAVMALTLSVTACGGSKGKTLEDYYNDPAVKSELDASFESMSQEGITISVEVEGNALTLTCKFEDSSFITDEVKTMLSDGLDENAATFESVVATWDEAIEQDPGTCAYVVRYTDSDDNVLVEKEFKAQ